MMSIIMIITLVMGGLVSILMDFGASLWKELMKTKGCAQVTYFRRLSDGQECAIQTPHSYCVTLY